MLYVDCAHRCSLSKYLKVNPANLLKTIIYGIHLKTLGWSLIGVLEGVLECVTINEVTHFNTAQLSWIDIFTKLLT